MKPETGLITRTIDSKTGLIYTPDCDGVALSEIFLAGTEPTATCPPQSYDSQRDAKLVEKIRNRLLLEDYNPASIDASAARSNQGGSTLPNEGGNQQSGSGGNPLLD